ncbi:ring finger domain-containing protein [Pochonia chlamydosporia 170]|uniref:Ring finger domain-containing protein n=1 Tax=Pochonia chlamydosporia 170 TaxID=1380566 RepID=A0A179F0W8_METCM|nr:ring finger domain-containing protein [Pochonia chlamydosporia 170]OAQ59042.1 ring finger domain-containing protein [Pochonia chlamydosporia 170]
MSLDSRMSRTTRVMNPTERMRIYMDFMTKDSWDTVKDELNLRMKDTSMAQLVNDVSQQFRIEILRQLDHAGITIDEPWANLQRERLHNDPDEVFPLVATKWLLQNLPVSMTRCNICGDGYARGEDVIKKACGKHTMHRFCLMARLREGGMPIYGPCGCNSGGVDVDSWRPFVIPSKSSAAKRYHRPATPMPKTFQLGEIASSSSSPDPDYHPDSDSASESDTSSNASDETGSVHSWSSDTTIAAEPRPVA